MRALLLAVALLAGCATAGERIALTQTAENLEFLEPLWREYVQTDVAIDDQEREDRLELWWATQRLVRAGLGEGRLAPD